ncbi:MAG: hypothetical protein NC899_09410, partial [Candidatus Omnitrophica bacterium]|nr:hypothetical protein [Candidatus Omnitrophota bacterium]
FYVGVSEIDITPPVGTLLAGGIRPRISKGIEDPLFVKSIVIETEKGERFTYVVLDLLCLPREIGDKCIKISSEKTGIPEEKIVWTTTHTHTGPYTMPLFGEDESVINKDWLNSLPEKFALSVEKAYNSKKRARMKHIQAFCNSVSHNRRVILKDGRAINTWNLENINIQILGSEGPIDPEIGILFFETFDGEPICLMFYFSLHTNSNFGEYFSSDYLGIVYSKMKEKFGSDFVTLFIPGAFANINPTRKHKEIGEILSEIIIKKFEKPATYIEKLKINSIKKEILVNFKNFKEDQKGRIEKSGWPEWVWEYFEKEVEILRKIGKRETKTLIQSWNIGNIGFVSFPGELFVEWGIKVKKESPFDWTYPVELGGDYIGYLITKKAWKTGGYEPLIARSSLPCWESVEYMVKEGIKLLKILNKRRSPNEET